MSQLIDNRNFPIRRFWKIAACVAFAAVNSGCHFHALAIHYHRYPADGGEPEITKTSVDIAKIGPLLQNDGPIIGEPGTPLGDLRP